MKLIYPLLALIITFLGCNSKKNNKVEDYTSEKPNIIFYLYDD